MKQIPAWKFWLFKWHYLPAAGFMGVGLHLLDEGHCITTLKLGWRNKNPFRSLYFAAQCAAAEMSTGLVAFQLVKDSGGGISMLITGMDSQYLKKATGRVHFICNEIEAVREAIQKARLQDEAITIAVPVQAIQQDNLQVVSEFTFHWSFRRKG